MERVNLNIVSDSFNLKYEQEMENIILQQDNI
jgi:hypothetical protein